MDLDRPTPSRALPFVVCALLGLLTLAVPPYDHVGAHLLVALPLFALVLSALGLGMLRGRRSGWFSGSVVAYFAMLAVLLDATGGSDSPLAPMTMLGILWVALYGSRTQMYLTAGLTAALCGLPIVLVGGPLYSAADWPRVLVYTSMAALVGPAVQEVVRQWRYEFGRERELTAENRAIMDGSHIASLITAGPDGVIRTFGVGAERLLGWSAHEVVGTMTADQFHDREELDAVAAELGVQAPGIEPGLAVLATLAHTRADSRIWTYVRKDGTTRFVRLALSVLRSDDGTVTGYLGIAIDSTEAIRDHRALIQAETRWEFLMENLPDTTVVTMSEDFTIGLVTGAGAESIGLADAAGKTLSQVSAPR